MIRHLRDVRVGCRLQSFVSFLIVMLCCISFHAVFCPTDRHAMMSNTTEKISSQVPYLEKEVESLKEQLKTAQIQLDMRNEASAKEIDLLDLRGAPAADRDFPGVTVDLAYTLNVSPSWWDDAQTSPSFDTLMLSLHRKDIWKDGRLATHLKSLQAAGFIEPKKIYGSPLRGGEIEHLLRHHKPKIFLEVGVYLGATSTSIAAFFKSEKGFEHSYVLSMDTWLLDLEFAWNGEKSSHYNDKKRDDYFTHDRLAGSSCMYYQFLANCIATNTSDRIIPVQTGSSNGIMALLSHGVRPDFMYIDASHANPDVFLDFENFYKILKPGGVMAFDDVAVVEATKLAFHRLADRYDLEGIHLNRNQIYVVKKE